MVSYIWQGRCLFYVEADVQICIRESSHRRFTLTSRFLGHSNKAEAWSRTKLFQKWGEISTTLLLAGVGRCLYVEVESTTE